MTDESGLQVMLCMKDVLIPPPEGETLWYNLQLLRWIQHFFLIHVLIFPSAQPILLSKFRSHFCPLCSAAAEKGHIPAWEGQEEGTSSTPCCSDKNSPLSTALTANKEILPIWQNISRVTFAKAGFVLCENPGAEHIPRAWLGRVAPAGSPAVTQAGRWPQGLDQVAFHTLDSQVKHEVVLEEDVAEGQPGWAGSCSSQCPVGLLQIASKSLELLNLGWGFASAPTAALVVYLDYLE